jgi:outer membrane protein
MPKLYFLLLFFCVSAGVDAQNPISISSLTDSILANNYSIRVAKIQEQIAENNNSAGRAGAFPQLNLNGGQNSSYYDTRQVFYSGEVREANNAVNNSINASLRLDWTLFAGFSVQATRDLLKVRSEMAQINTVISLEEQLFSAASLFYEILLRDKLILSYEMAVKLSQERKKLAEDRLKMGKGSQLDILQSSVDLNADSSLLMREKISRNNLIVQLSTLIGSNETISILPQGDILLSDLPPLEEIIDRALSQNSRILQEKARKTLAYAEMKQAKSNLYPRLGVYGEYYFLRSESQVGLLKNNQNIGPGTGISLNYRLFDGWNVQKDIKNSRLQLDISNLELENAKNEIRGSAIQAYNNYLLNKQLWALEKENVLTAEKSMEIAKKQLALGIITDLAFRENQLNYNEAVARELESQYRAKISELQLHLLSSSLLGSLKN